MDIDPGVLKKITADPLPKCESCEDVSVTSVAYCFVCSILYCQNCWEHHQQLPPMRVHDSITLDDALNKMKEKPQAAHGDDHWEDAIAITIQEAMKQSAALPTACNGFMVERDKLQQVMARGQEVKKSIQQRRKEVDSDITTAFAKLQQVVQQILHQRKRFLLSQSCHIAVSKETRLSVQLEGLQPLRTAMKECHDMSKKAKTQEDWSQVQVRAEHLLAQFSDTSLELCDNAVMLVEVKADNIIAFIESFGYVATGAFPSKSIIVDPPPFAVVNKEVTFSVHNRSASGEGIGHGGEVVQGVLAKKGEAESRVMATTRDGGDGMYHLSITPKVIGEYSLSVSVHGQHVESSPIVLHVTRDYAALKEPVEKITDQVHSPRCIAFADNTDIFLVCQDQTYICQGQEAVRIFDSNGCYKSTIGRKGRGDLEFAKPYGIAISGNTVYVADNGNHRIQMFTTSGKFLGKFGSEGSGNNQFVYPAGVCVGDNGMVYIGDSGNHRVQIFHADGTFSHSIDGNHSREGAFKNPWCLALGPNGELHVTGNYSRNVTVFSPKGRFVWSYEVIKPQGIAIDRAGFSFVSSNGSLSIFNPFGRLVKEIKGIGHATAVAIAPDGFVWVSIDSPHHLLKY